jgi:hypothetical protein
MFSIVNLHSTEVDDPAVAGTSKIVADRKIIARKSGNLHSMLIISFANDGESSQN